MAQFMTPPPQDYWLVMDFEATCEDKRRDWPNEIIEFPAIMIRASDGKTLGEFESFVKPTENPVLTSFCTSLTSIRQSDVENAPILSQVLTAFDQWVQSFLILEKNPTILPIFCGDWDLNTCLPKECIRKQLCNLVPKYLGSWCNLKVSFESTMKVKSGGMANMLKVLGIGLVGTHHRGIDDSRNIARILAALVGRGGKRFVKQTKSLKLNPSTSSLFLQAGQTTSLMPTHESLSMSTNQVATQALDIIDQARNGNHGGSSGGGASENPIDSGEEFPILSKKCMNKNNSSKAERRAYQEQQRASKMVGTSVNMTNEKYFSAVCKPLSVRDLQRAHKGNLDVLHDRSVGLVCLCTSPLHDYLEGQPSVLLILPKRHKKVDGEESGEVNEWVFPKGHPVEGESDVEAAIRETMEEAGVQISNVFESIASSSGYSYIGHLHSDKWKLHVDYPDETKRPLLVIHKTVQYFLATMSGRNQTQLTVATEGPSESAMAAWMPLNKAERCLKYKEDKSMLLYFNKAYQTQLEVAGTCSLPSHSIP